MDNRIIHLARESARMAGLDPDQLVVALDSEEDYDLHQLGYAPVDIKKMHPVFMVFYDKIKRDPHLWESQLQSIVMTLKES